MSTFAPKAPRLDLTRVRAQIEMLRAAHPDIWEDDDLVAGMLEGETDLHAFLSEIVRRICWANALSNGIQFMISDALARQERFEQRVEVLRALAFKVLQIADTRKVELPEATVSVRAGQRKVIITDEAQLPDNVVRIKREPAKNLIKELIDQGVAVPGAELSNAEPVLHMGLK